MKAMNALLLLLLLLNVTRQTFAAPSGTSSATDLATDTPSTQRQPVRLCPISDAEEAKCKAIEENLAARGLSPGIECVRGRDKYDCMQLVQDGSADLISCWSMDAYVAGLKHNLVPLLREKVSAEDGWTYAYYAMAVVRKDDGSIHSVEDLRGKRSCHTGVNRHVGWLYPFAQFVNLGLIQTGDCVNNVANMAAFFNESCASGAKNPAFNPDGLYDNLCALCGGQGDAFCSKSDPYASYEGALKCLLDGRGDVAFIKDTTFGKVIQERPEVANQKGDYELLCLDGSRKPVDEYKACNWGTIPERALMTSAQLSPERRQEIKTLFAEAQEDHGDFIISLFESASYGGKNLLFHDDTKSLEDVGDRDDYEKYLGDYMTVRNKQFLCPTPAVRWCTISEAETRKCYRMRDAFLASFIKPDIECVQAADTAEGMQFIKEGKADLVTLDGGDIYKGGKEYDLQVIMNENYGQGDAKYWAVAVVKKSNGDISFKTLKGKKSCHTGIGRTAGWNIPAVALLDSNQIANVPNCSMAEALGNFFSASCAPGALSPKFNPSGTNPESLCTLCAGNGTDKCSRTENEPFYGYTGSFRCMATGAGDVAFVKHVTALQNTDGHNQDAWAHDLLSQDFELLCKDDSRKPVTDFESCNLAKVPSHAVVTAASKTPEEVRRFLFLLEVGQSYFGNSTSFALFKSGPGVKDLLFTDSTTSLGKVPEDKRKSSDYLGETESVFDHLSDCGSL